jgi:dihydroorotase
MALLDQYRLKGRVINTHGHPRNPKADGDGRSELMIPLYDQVFGDVIGIGNTAVPLTTVERALAMKQKWQAIAKNTRMHVAGLLTEQTTPEEIIAGYDRPQGQEAWIAMKMFLRAVSNAGGHDVDNLKAVIACIKAMTYTKWKHKKKPMVLKIHCERKFTILGRIIPVVDRERIAVQRDVEYILKHVPDAVIEICHISDGETIEAIRYFQKLGYKVFGEISPHYTEYCSDDLYDDGQGGTAFNSHRFCLPIFKTPKDRQIILSAMVSGEPWWHYGDDGACHNDNPVLEKGVKINYRGIVLGGQTQLPTAVVSYVLEKFAEAKKARYAQAFLIDNARKLYGLEKDESETVFNLSPWEVPGILTHEFDDHSKTIACRVAMGGQKRMYQIAA